MTTARHRMMHTGNEIGVFLHRVAKGRLDSFGDTHVLMLTCPGRRTGQPRSTMIRYLEHDGGYLVWGTGSGSPSEPDWFRNLRTSSEAQVEIGRPPSLCAPRSRSRTSGTACGTTSCSATPRRSRSTRPRQPDHPGGPVAPGQPRQQLDRH